MEVAGGNVSLLLAAAIVIGFRWPAAWSLILLTKITPGIGLLWFAVRREWRSLGIALGATAVIALVSFVLLPDQWRAWVDVVIQNAAAGKSGTWASVPIPLWIRLPFAIALVVWGARTDRRWTVPVGAMLALPALWYGGLSMLLAVIPLLPDRPAAARR
jgi:Glycosyltransferase family 87